MAKTSFFVSCYLIAGVANYTEKCLRVCGYWEIELELITCSNLKLKTARIGSVESSKWSWWILRKMMYRDEIFKEKDFGNLSSVCYSVCIQVDERRLE